MKGLWKIIALLVIFGVLFGAVAYLNSTRKKEQTQLRIETTTKMFPGLDEAGMFRITVSDLKYDSYILRKTAGIWEIAQGPSAMSALMRNSQKDENGNPIQQEPDPRDDTGPAGDQYRSYLKADMEKVTPIIDTIKELESGQLVTSKPEEKSKLGVMGSLMGTEIHVYDSENNELVGVILGAPEGNYTSTYIRKPDSDDIYRVDGNAYMPFQKKVGDFRDRKLFDTAPEAINSVNVTDNENGRVYNLTRVDLEFKGSMADGTGITLDTAKVDDLLSALGSLSVASFVNPDDEVRGPRPDGGAWDPADPFGLRTPLRIISYTDSAGSTFTVNIGMKAGSNYYGIIADKPMDIFKVSVAKINEISPDPLTLGPAPETTDISTSPGVAELPPGRAEVGDMEEGRIGTVPPPSGGE